MNTAKLAQHYEVLTPWQRLPLLVAASSRADEAEHDRLVRSAPTLTFHVPDHWGLADGMRHLVTYYVLRQLELTVLHWSLLSTLEEMPTHGARDRKGSSKAKLDREARNRELRAAHNQEARVWRTLRFLAHGFVVRADGSVISARNQSGFWSGDPLSATLRPGDTVVVPEKALNVGGKNWTAIMQTAQVASSVALAVAYIHP